MKKRNIAILAAAVLTVIPVAATVTTRTAQLEFNNIKITFNGGILNPTDANGNAVEPFIIDGTTYLPVRAISNALGLQVGWDESTSTVMLSNNSGSSGSTFDLYQSGNIKTELIPSDDPKEIYIKATNISSEPIEFSSYNAFMNAAGRPAYTAYDSVHLAPGAVDLIRLSCYDPYVKMIGGGSEERSRYTADYCYGNQVGYSIERTGDDSCNITLKNNSSVNLDSSVNVLYMRNGTVVAWDFILAYDFGAGTSETFESEGYFKGGYDSVLVFPSARSAN